MTNLLFLLWLLLFPLVEDLGLFIRYKAGIKHIEHDSDWISCLFMLFIWGYVAYLLYNK